MELGKEHGVRRACRLLWKQEPGVRQRTGIHQAIHSRDMTKAFPVKSSCCKFSLEQQPQNFRDISGRLNQHRSRNLCPVTKDLAEAFSEVCQHCAPNGYTRTRTILASHESMSSALDQGAWRSTANRNSSSNPFKRHDKSLPCEVILL